ncbi:MAG TPA: twin-arginine translocase TatA/TatE family subunit [Symbiobacteriaceae bacterium]|jgi:sec-independent protein translocase protein TatA
MFERLGVGEILLILVAVLLIFGPSKLPALGKSIGEGMREFKKSISGTGESAEQKEPEKKA